MPAPSHEYGSVAARHYSAYRPPLHQMIVDEALKDQRCQTALDVGCGTGHSTIALKKFSRRVIGVDSSPAMLAAATQLDNTEYLLGTATDLPLAAQTIDLVSLAGVLPYLDKAALIQELIRVCRPLALVLPYDFRITMKPLKELFEIDHGAAQDLYDHAENFDDQGSFDSVATATKRVSFNITSAAASHLLLSSERRFELLAKQFDTATPFSRVQKTISEAIPRITLEATIWFTLYKLRPDLR